MNDIDRLRRRYARLLWAYPRWYRKERGTELVTTLLDDAAPGQRRPTRVDLVDMVRGGLRTRLLPPRGLGAAVVTVVAALYAALAGASAAVLLGPYPGPPTEAQAAEVATLATGQPPHNVPGPTFQCFAGCPQWDGVDEVMAFDAPPERIDNTVVHYPQSPPQTARTVETSRDRLAAAGWRVDPIAVQRDGTRSFRASRGHLGVFAVNWEGGTPLEIYVSKNLTPTILGNVAAGMLVGLLVGWVTAASTLRRYRRHAPAQRTRIAQAAAPFLLFAPIMVALAGLLFLADAANAGLSPEDIQIPLIFTTVPWPFTTAAVVSALFARGLATRAPHPYETRSRTARHA
jgi:hypothetical protein